MTLFSYFDIVYSHNFVLSGLLLIEKRLFPVGVNSVDVLNFIKTLTFSRDVHNSEV